MIYNFVLFCWGGTFDGRRTVRKYFWYNCHRDRGGRPRGTALIRQSCSLLLLGFTQAELRNKQCQEFSPPEDAERDWVLFEEVRQGSIDNYLLEKRLIRKDSTTFWGRLRISQMQNHAGPPLLVVAMVEDITEKKSAKANLQRSEASLQTLAGRLIQARRLHDKALERGVITTPNPALGSKV